MLANLSYAKEPTINPNGVFFNSFSGGFSGTKWFHTTYSPTTNQYHMADIFGGGFLGTTTQEGKIVLENGLGKGEFSDQNNYIVKPTLGKQLFTFVCNRVPYTNEHFILQLDKPHAANPKYNGEWQVAIDTVNPETGVTTATKTDRITLKSGDTTLRITDTQGHFMQGVFASNTIVAFRKVVPTPKRVEFASFPGSDISMAQNLLGQMSFESANHFTATFLLQSRTPLGSQTQQVLRYTATRTVD